MRTTNKLKSYAITDQNEKIIEYCRTKFYCEKRIKELRLKRFGDKLEIIKVK